MFRRVLLFPVLVLGFLRACPLPCPAQVWTITNNPPEHALSASNLVNILNRNFASVGTNLAAVQASLAAKGDAQVLRLSFEGDSIVHQVIHTWPDFLAAHSVRFARGTSVTNYGLSGDRVANMPAEYATQAHLNRPQSATEEGWFFLHAGGNDIVDGTSAATIYQNLKNLWESARLDGYKVVAVHVLPRYNWPADAPAFEAARLELNRLIDSDRTLYDYVIAVDAVINNSLAGNTAYLVDGTHPTDPLGADILAQTVASVIDGKPFEMLPTAALDTNAISSDLVLLPFGGRNVIIGAVTNAANVKLQVARSYQEPTGGLDTNTMAVFADNNRANQAAGVSFLARSSQSFSLNFGNENAEKAQTMKVIFSGVGTGFNWMVGGTTRAHLDNTGFGIGTIAPVANVESAATTEQFRLSYGNTSSTTNAAFTVGADGILTIAPSSGHLALTGSMLGNSFVLAGANSMLGWNGQGGLLPAGDGVFTLFNNANTGFTALQFGGRTASVPELRPNGVTLEVRKGDGSVLAPLAASTLTLSTNDVPVFANNAAAIAGSRAVGQIYRTGADPDVICIVH